MAGTSADVDEGGAGSPGLVVIRWGRCGDTLPAEVERPARCPRCGSTQVDEAHEPLL